MFTTKNFNLSVNYYFLIEHVFDLFVVILFLILLFLFCLLSVVFVCLFVCCLFFCLFVCLRFMLYPPPRLKSPFFSNHIHGIIQFTQTHALELTPTYTRIHAWRSIDREKRWGEGREEDRQIGIHRLDR